MRTKLVFGACMCLASAFAGFLFAYMGFVIPARQDAADAMVFRCENSLRMLKEIQKTNIEAVAEAQERTLKTSAALFSGPLQNHPGAKHFLWAIKDYYRGASNSAPEEIREYLQGVSEQEPYHHILYHSGE